MLKSLIDYPLNGFYDEAIASPQEPRPAAKQLFSQLDGLPF